MKSIRFITTGLVLFLALSAFGIDFTRVNIAWQYDPLAEVELRSRVVQNGSILTVFLRMKADSLQDWSIEYLVQDRYDSETHSEFNQMVLDTLWSKNGSLVLKLQFTKPTENLLVAKVNGPDAFYYYDISLKNGSLPFPAVYPQDEDGLPIFENFISRTDHQWVGSNQLYVHQYQERFTLADPPMAEMKPLAPSIAPDSSFAFQNGDMFLDDHFYVVLEDTNASAGVTVLKTAPYFPEFKLLNELTSSMFYILNEPERKGFRNSRNLKQSFDSFWINTFTTKFRARNAIRNYFNWVEQANYIFTDFKQGWKTDRGMLYIVFGVPDEVYRTENAEEWYYDNGPSFEFTVISTFFAPRTYALRRRVEFETVWYEYIGAIRRGANE